MDRHTYVQTLRAVAYELYGLQGEWITDDGQCLDDEVNDELQVITIALEEFIAKLKAKAPI